MSAIDDYRAALNRLIENRPDIVPKGSAINKDSVALEAGRKRGSIKKSRAEHAGLIADIEAAAVSEQAKAKPTASQEVEKQKALKKAAQGELEVLKDNYALALQKIISLVHENYQLKKRITELGGGVPSVSKFSSIGMEGRNPNIG